VVKSFGTGPLEVRAVNGISLRIAAGEFVAIMGPSGCGKSTLLHLAGALEDPSAGRVLVDGQDLATLDARDRSERRRRDVGYVFQRLNLIPALTAVENVMLPLELDGVSTGPARRAAIAAMQRVGLDHHLDRYPDDFSGGQQQRIAIARAVVGQRRLLLADEPTGALDTANSDQVVELLRSLCDDHGTSVVMVTHEPRFASWADRVVFLRDGRIVDESTPAPSRNGGDPSESTGDARRGPTARSGGHADLELIGGHGRRPRWSTWRLAARLARREVRRRPGRTALVAALVAVPVLAMTFAVVVATTQADTPQERFERFAGQSDFYATSFGGDVGPLQDALPDGSRTVTMTASRRA
jgi:putative ABC transport system ATP-binding protein